MKLSHPVNSASEDSAPKQRRALLTRKKLIRAARIIFARDGFEHARIEDIAARAGKTRGAFYDNFDGKEDVFFAIFEENILSDHKKVVPLLKPAATTDKRIERIAEILVTLLRDRQRSLLNLEFKMYVIRHPHKQKRLAALHRAMLLRCVLTEMNQLFPEIGEGTLADRHRRILELAAAVDGFTLNKLFSPANMDEPQLRRLLRQTLRDTIFQDYEAKGTA
jgi:AcrR family transcriptional regulator